jgi:uncharacterized repeat protein (TIGR01451 family)
LRPSCAEWVATTSSLARAEQSGDLYAELDESFHVDLGPPSRAGVSASPSRGTGLIVNDDLYADISVSNTNGATSQSPGQSTTYAVTVRNTSTVVDVPAVQVTQTLPATLTNVSWTCVGSGGATCPASGGGALGTTLSMPKGSSVAYQVNATLMPTAGALIEATVSATVVAPYTDPELANNSATDADSVNIVHRDGFE